MNPEQSNPDGEFPPRTYLYPKYFLAYATISDVFAFDDTVSALADVVLFVATVVLDATDEVFVAFAFLFDALLDVV